MTCHHPRAAPGLDACHCPDCGKTNTHGTMDYAAMMQLSTYYPIRSHAQEASPAPATHSPSRTRDDRGSIPEARTGIQQKLNL